MNSVVRLSQELTQLSACLTLSDLAAYLGRLLVHAPGVLRSRSLVPADRAMHGDVAVTIGGKPVVVPLATTEALLAAHDPTPTFGAVREMYAGNVYLRGFRPGLTADTVLDLGSNRGLFLIQGAVQLGARLAIGVEPQLFYDPVFWAIADANRLDRDRFLRIGRFIASTPGEQATSVEEIMRENRLADISFLKCDVEGAEFDVMCRNNGFLDRVGNIAMELHPDKGDMAELVKALTAHRFEVRVTDQFGRACRHEAGHYLYASRTGDLAGQ